MIATLTCLLVAPTAALDVLDVTPAGGPYTSIQAAVHASSDGDVIRVAPGRYDSFAIRGKAISVVGGAGVRVDGVVRIQELSEGQSASLHGVVIDALLPQSEERLIIGHNEGSVRIEDVRLPFTGSSNFMDPVAGGARVVASADVTFVNCVLTPKTLYDSWFHRFYGSYGLTCAGSNVGLYGCEVSGAGVERSGLYFSGGNLELVGTEVRGGTGTDTYVTFAGNCRGGPAGRGGNAVSLTSGHVTTVDCTLIPGLGSFDACYGYSYPDGDPLSLGSATLEEAPGVAPALEVPPLVAESAPFAVQMTVEPDDQPLLLASARPARVHVPGAFGPLLVDGSAAYRRIPLPVGGLPSLTLQAPGLPSLTTLELHLQLLCLRPDPQHAGATVTVAGPPQVVTVLDSAY